MAEVTWSGFQSRIAARVPQCPTFRMEEAIADAAREFYLDTRAWRVEGVTVATTVASQATYTVSGLPANSELVGLPAAWAGTEEIEELAPGKHEDDTMADASDTFRIGVSGAAQVRLSPKPLTAGIVVKATVALRPTSAATGIDDTLYWQHREAIEAKALQTLMLDVNKPWSNPQMAVYFGGEYDRLALQASSEAGPKRRTPLRTKHAEI